MGDSHSLSRLTHNVPRRHIFVSDAKDAATGKQIVTTPDHKHKRQQHPDHPRCSVGCFGCDLSIAKYACLGLVTAAVAAQAPICPLQSYVTGVSFPRKALTQSKVRAADAIFG